MRRPRWQVEHLSIRLSALILAIILWFLAAGRPPRDTGVDTRLVTRPISVINVAPEWTVTEGPEEAHVLLEGPRLILMLQGNRTEVFVDATGVDLGLHRLPVQADLPSGLRVRSIDPDEVDVRIEAP